MRRRSGPASGPAPAVLRAVAAAPAVLRAPAAAALALVLALGAGSAPLAGAEPAELRRLFPQEAEVAAGDGRLSRLVLPPEILSACRPDLSDLRLFDAQDREIAFLVDAGTAPPGGVEATERHEPPLREAARSEIRREDGPPLRRESYEFDLPDAAPRSGNWVLVAEPRAAEFVARVGVEGIGAAGAPVPLVKDGSLFRLRGAPAAGKVRLPLPPYRGRRLRVVLETEHPFWLEPSLRLESARLLERGGRIAVPLRVLGVRAGDRRTLVDLARPPGIVPDLLRVDTATGTFDRGVEVWDDGPAGADARLGAGRVYRVAALVPVGEQELALRAARGDRLRIEIDDGDSPPLEAPEFFAVIRQPSLIFAGAGGVLRFGGGRAHPPRYDLAGLLPAAERTATGKRAEAAALLYDPATVKPARLGPIRPNPAYDGAPALAFAMHPGAGVDRGRYSHLRRLAVPASAEGLSRLRLEPADLAILGDDLSDLRVADAGSRQWPYLLAREAATDLVALAVEGPARRDATSRYELQPPVSPLRFDRLLLDTDTRFFNRGFTLQAEDGAGERRTLLRGRLARPAGDPRPVSLDLAPVRARALTLLVEDGDDAPLAFRSVQVRVPLPEIYLTAPQGDYSLLLGAPDQAPPRYELERVRDVVLAVQAAPIEAGALEANPDYSLHARLKGRGLRQTALLWSALVAAVVVLALLTLRLARREPASPACWLPALALPAAAALLLGTAPAAAHEPATTCAEARRTHGWCEAERTGYVAGVAIRSRQLYEALDAHGHAVERGAVTCATCLEAIDSDGFCPDHRMGYVGGEAFLSPLTWEIARARTIDPGALSCRECRRHSRGIGWCERHRVGIAGTVAIDDRARFEAFRAAYGILMTAIEKSADCESCAAAMVADGYCATHRIRYKDGRPLP